jgi:simple sugar transport system permease protein
MSAILSTAFLFTVILQTTPLMLAGTGGLFAQQSNVLNIALDGMMLMGAFMVIAVGAKTGNIVIALLAAVAAGMVLALIFGFTVLWLRADAVVVGIGIGLLVSGLTVLLLSVLYKSSGSYVPKEFPNILKLNLGPAKHVPVLGPALQGQTFLVIVAVVLVPIAAWVLYRTRWGLRVRAVGEEEAAASAAGLKPRRIKLSAILVSGALCGLAGAQLATATLDQFIANMTAGRGFIVIAAIFVGRARPWATAGACLVFGIAGALAIQLQLNNLPPDLLLMLPYVVTVLLLVLRPVLRLVRAPRSGAPAAVPEPAA